MIRNKFRVKDIDKLFKDYCNDLFYWLFNPTGAIKIFKIQGMAPDSSKPFTNTTAR